MPFLQRFVFGVTCLFAYLGIGWVFTQLGSLFAPSAQFGHFLVALGVLGAPFAVGVLWPMILKFLSKL
jgi:hypothetical protein